MIQTAGRDPADPFIALHARAIPPGAAALDLACGAGRHSALMLARERVVTAVDRDTAPLRAALGEKPMLEVVEADLEAAPWPLPGRRFGGIVVCNYLHRPLFPAIFAALAPGGALIYATFMQGNEVYGRPANLDFLLAPDELLDLCRTAGLRVAAFEQGRRDAPKPAMRQAICALRPHGPS